MSDDLDALRARVYGPDATDADVARYRAALRPPQPDRPRGAPAPATEGRGGAEVAPRPPRRSARRAARPLVVGLVAVLVGIGLVLALMPRGRAEPAPVPLAIPEATRASFVRALQAGRIADVSGFFADHHDRLPPVLRTVGRADTEEYTGTGPRTLDVNPSALADRGGRITVVLVTAADAEGRWTASRSVLDVDDGRVREQPMSASRGAYRAGLPASATARYRGQAPDRLRLEVPARVRWGLAVVLSE